MRKHSQRIEVDSDGTAVSSVWTEPENYLGGALVLAHGAGSDMHHPFLTYVHEFLAARGLLTVKFNFPYREAGRKAPDRAPRLLQTWRAVLRALREDADLAPKRVFIGGRSMGGRMASMLAAEGESVDGLVLLGYPLHPAGKPEKLRAEHLSAIRCPMLFIQGSRDRLCDLSLLRDVIKNLPAPVTLHVIEEGDHGFKVPKRTGRTEEDVNREIVEVIASWLGKLS